MYHLLGYHTAHADTNDVNRSFTIPAKVIEQLESILGHLRRRVAHDGLVASAHATVIEDEARVFGGLVMTEIYGLSLPVPFKGAKTHDPLASSLSLGTFEWLCSELHLLYGNMSATYYQTYGPSAMDLICDIDGTSSAMRNSTCSLARWLEMPDNSVEGRMFNQLGNSEGHVSSCQMIAAKPGFYVLSIS